MACLDKCSEPAACCIWNVWANVWSATTTKGLTAICSVSNFLGKLGGAARNIYQESWEFLERKQTADPLVDCDGTCGCAQLNFDSAYLSPRPLSVGAVLGNHGIFWVGLGKLVERLGFRSSDRWKPMVVASVFCLSALPGRSGLAPWYLRDTVSGEEPVRLTNIATIRFLQCLPLVIKHGRTLNVLEPDYSRAVYAGWDFHRISQTECRPFSECIQRKRPEVIINNDRLEMYYLARDDVGYKKFFGQPDAFGYKRMDVPKQTVQIFVRSDILRQAELH